MSTYTYTIEILQGHTPCDHLIAELAARIVPGRYSSSSAASRGGHRAVALAARGMGRPSLSWGVRIIPTTI